MRSPLSLQNRRSLFFKFNNALMAGLFFLASSASGFAAIKIWTGDAGDTLWSSSANWSPAGAPDLLDNVTFTNLAVTDVPFSAGGIADSVVDPEFRSSINSLGFRNISGFHNLTLINPLVVTGSSATDVAFLADDGQTAVLFTGSGQADGKDDAVYASINGDSLTVSNVNASLSVMQASATSGAHRATLDLSGLNSFTCVVSNILVGHDFGVPITRPTGTLILGVSNSITAKLISIADAYQNAGAISYIHLGQANTLNVDRIRIALHKCVATMDMTPGLLSGPVKFRNSTAAGRQISWEVGDEYEPNDIGYFTSSQSTGIIDLTGGVVDALVDRIVLGRGQTNAPTRTGDGNGTLTFGGGVIDVNTLEMGIQLSGGGSAGRGTVNINNDDGLTPGVMRVNKNVVMAVQLAGNTEATGSTATFNLTGGRLEVGGDIIDGGGTSTVTIDNGGVLDMQPAGDSTRGNITIDVLNFGDGTVTNFDTLSVKTIALQNGATSFTVYPGQKIAPIGVGKVGTLDVNGDLILRGTTVMDVSKNGTTLAADQITATGNLDLGGTLTVNASGDALAVGNKFVLFSAPTMANAFTTVNLPPAGPGLAWTNRIAVDGSIEVIASGEPTDAPTLAFTSTRTSITLSWPTAYTSFVLRGQTNATSGLSNNWGPVSGVVGNQVTIPINPANRSVFFQLFQQ